MKSFLVAAMAAFVVTAHAADRYVLIEGNGSGNIARWDLQTNTVSNFITCGHNNYINSIVVGPDGNIYVGFSDSSTVEEFNGVSGADTKTFVNQGPGFPHGLAFDSLGSLYVASNTNNTITRYNWDGSFSGTFASSGISGPRSLLFDTAGNLYCSNYNNNQITEFNSSGHATAFATDNGDLDGIAFDSGGNLYVNNYAAGGSVDEFNSAGQSLGHFTTNVNDGRGIVADDYSPSQHLFVAEENNDDVKVYNTAGALTYSLNLAPLGYSRLSFMTSYNVVPDPAPVLSLSALLSGWTLLRRKLRKRG